MTEMKYRAGNKVRIKSLDWYNENKGMNGLVGLFTPSMKKLCGMVVTLDSAYNGKYTAIEKEAKGYYLDDSMIEELMENDNPFDEDMIPLPDSFVERMAEKIATSELFKAEPLDIPTMTTDFVKEHGFPCPNGYTFKDENGNVINATKIVLEKKKGLTQERISTIVHESCILFCEHCGCGIPRDTCTSLGTCDEHDEYRKHIRTYLEKHKK